MSSDFGSVSSPDDDNFTDLADFVLDESDIVLILRNLSCFAARLDVRLPLRRCCLDDRPPSENSLSLSIERRLAAMTDSSCER